VVFYLNSLGVRLPRNISCSLAVEDTIPPLKPLLVLFSRDKSKATTTKARLRAKQHTVSLFRFSSYKNQVQGSRKNKVRAGRKESVESGAGTFGLYCCVVGSSSVVLVSVS